MTSKSAGPSGGDMATFKKWFEEIHKNNLGHRAQLRRCETLEEVYFCEGFHDLVGRLKAKRHAEKPDSETAMFKPKELDRIALIAATFAILRDWNEGKKSMGEAFASPGGNALSLSPLRFRRLLTCTEPADLLAPLRRAVRVIKLQVPTRSLAESLLSWDDKTRKKWALNYYQHHK